MIIPLLPWFIGIMGDYAIITPATWKALRACPLFANLDDVMVCIVSCLDANKFKLISCPFGSSNQLLALASENYCNQDNKLSRLVNVVIACT